MQLDELIVALANGERERFRDLYEQTKKLVYYTAYSILRDRALTEDVMQTTYLNVIRYAKSYKAGTSPRAWIARIAKNEALNVKKKREREVSVDEKEHLPAFGATHTDDYGLLLELAKSLLPDDEFLILTLVAVEGYKRREVADELSMPLPTVTWKYHKAIKSMQRALKDEERRTT